MWMSLSYTRKKIKSPNILLFHIFTLSTLIKYFIIMTFNFMLDKYSYTYVFYSLYLALHAILFRVAGRMCTIMCTSMCCMVGVCCVWQCLMSIHHTYVWCLSAYRHRPVDSEAWIYKRALYYIWRQAWTTKLEQRQHHQQSSVVSYFVFLFFITSNIGIHGLCVCVVCHERQCILEFLSHVTHFRWLELTNKYICWPD